MRNIILSIVILALLSSSYNVKNNADIAKGIEIKEIDSVKKYEYLIMLIKESEGFSSKIYDDNGYIAIGYGFRVNIWKIEDTIMDKKTADSMLNKIVREIYNIIDKKYRNLDYSKKLALTSIAYNYGIKNMEMIVDNNGKVKWDKRVYDRRRELEYLLYNI